MFTVILYQPEIPPNTGNIIRLCANTDTDLCLIRPLGFDLSDKKLRRAGLDYHDTRRLRVYDSLQDCLSEVQPAKLWLFTTKAKQPHSAAVFTPSDALLFGSETKGVPESVHAVVDPACRLRIPMVGDSRSMNLSNAVGVGLYEAWRQHEFKGGETF